MECTPLACLWLAVVITLTGPKQMDVPQRERTRGHHQSSATLE
ncbi:rCG43667 [Rattus norvegicus]|uniref:RCG43667 n=1 Tax=Rattus norvegicus TaxID=10116 RepID=A6JIJ5_RAT|nr:rCG43667 [Rattus norvegicus]